MGRPSNTEERQAEIVAGLLQVMAKSGYEKASISAIAKAAGLSQGVVHYHFRSKQEILLRLVATLRDTVEARYREMVGDCETPMGKLNAYIDAHLAVGRGADRGILACWVSIAAESIRQPEVGAVYRRMVADELVLLQKLVRGTLSKPRAPARIVKPIAITIYAAIQGGYQLAAAAPDTVPAGSAAPAVRHLARSLVEAHARES